MHILSRGLNPHFSFTSVSMNVKDRSKCLILSSLSDALLKGQCRYFEPGVHR